LTSDRRLVFPAGGSRFEIEPHNCFACGTLNDHGLRMRLHLAGERAWSELTIEPRFEGWDGIAHGGILGTILDEIMGWSLSGTDDWGVTARMSVEFRKPVPVGTPIRAEGWVTRSRRRLIETAGRITDVAGTLEYATSTGLYLAADEARKAELRERYGVRELASHDERGARGAPGERSGQPEPVAAR
jgi:acyl-coenzyme A thioesterase PaaI-like protein